MVERFIRTMKSGCTKMIKVPLQRDAMRRDLTFYLAWYNEHSPCAAPQAKVRGRTGSRFVLTIAFMENRKHLPFVTLREVA
jgi:hypothetical protein